MAMFVLLIVATLMARGDAVTCNLEPAIQDMCRRELLPGQYQTSAYILHTCTPVDIVYVYPRVGLLSVPRVLLKSTVCQ